MKKLTALITTLVLGSSGVALADHTPNPAAQGWSNRVNDHRDHRLDDGFRQRGERWGFRDDAGPRRYRTSWVALSSTMQLGRGRSVIDVNDRGTFTQLRLQTTNGASVIERVVIVFADGSRQVVEQNRLLSPRNRMFEIALDGNNRRIDKILVMGESRRNAAIQVFAI